MKESVEGGFVPSWRWFVFEGVFEFGLMNGSEGNDDVIGKQLVI
jgi:hypothetical protein